MENISTGKSQKHSVLQGQPPHPISRGHRVFHIQELQSRCRGRWLEMAQLQVRDSLAVGDKKLSQHLPFPHQKCWQMTVGSPALVQ